MAGIGEYIHYWYANYEKYGTNFPLGPQESKVGSAAIGMKIMQQQKAKMLNQVRLKQKHNNYQGLENALNNIYYPKTPEDTSAHDRMAHVVETVLGEQALRWAVNWAQGGGAYKRGIGEKSYFRLSTVVHLKQDIERTLKMITTNHNLNAAKNATDKLETLLAQVRSLEAQAQAILKEAPNNTGIISIKQNTNVSNTINSINKALDTITSASRSATIGDLFEIGTASLDDRMGKVIDKHAINMIKNELVTGNKTAQVSITPIGSWANMAIIPETKHSQVLEDGTKVNITLNGDLETKYKMDVNLTYDNEQYRISAKNYLMKHNMNIHLLNGSPLLNIMQKNADADFINHFLNITLTNQGRSSKGQILDLAHDTMKTMIILEALTGMSQKTGYADTLVINNRTAKRIIVKPMAQMINAINDNYFRISGYELDTNSKTYNQWVGSSGRDLLQSRTRIANMIAKLHAAKINVSLNTTTLFDKR